MIFAILFALLCAPASADEIRSPLSSGLNLSPASVSVTGTPGFSGDASGITGYAVMSTSITYIAPSSYTFVSANTYITLATATITARGGRNLFTPTAISIYSTGIATSFCCQLLFNGVAILPDQPRCQQMSNSYANMTLNPILIGGSLAGTESISVACLVSQYAVGTQAVSNVRVDAIEF